MFFSRCVYMKTFFFRFTKRVANIATKHTPDCNVSIANVSICMFLVRCLNCIQYMHVQCSQLYGKSFLSGIKFWAGSKLRMDTFWLKCLLEVWYHAFACGFKRNSCRFLPVLDRSVSVYVCPEWKWLDQYTHVSLSFKNRLAIFYSFHVRSTYNNFSLLSWRCSLVRNFYDNERNSFCRPFVYSLNGS